MGDVAGDADHAVALSGPLPHHAPTFGQPDHRPVRPHDPVVAIVHASLQCLAEACADAVAIVCVEHPRNVALEAERTGGEPEELLRIGRPGHLAGGHLPFPGGHLRHVQRHAQPRLVLLDTLMRSRERHRSLLDAALELLVDPLECGLCGLAIDDLTPKRVVQVRKRPGLPEQLDEDPDLRAEDVRVDRLAQVIDGAGAVAAEDVALVGRVRRQEQDRNVLRSLALLDQLCQLDAGDAWHADVEHNRRELVAQQAEERLVGRLRAHEDALGRREHDLEGIEVAGLIIDNQHLRALGSHHQQAQRYSQTRNSDSNWSVLTGLAM